MLLYSPRSTLFPYTTLFRSMKYAVRVQMDPQSLADRGIGVDQVAAAISNGNPNTPTGSLYGKNTNLTLQTNGQRSEEHTSELQSPYDLVCRLQLEKKKIKKS